MTKDTYPEQSDDPYEKAAHQANLMRMQTIPSTANLLDGLWYKYNEKRRADQTEELPELQGEIEGVTAKLQGELAFIEEHVAPTLSSTADFLLLELVRQTVRDSIDRLNMLE